jgi:23S rRNA pseudouridine1911/1915/1917 synthase
VHPGAGRPGGTLVNVLLGMKVRLSSVGARARPGIVHRLDRDTSGLMVVAKTDAAYWKLVRMVEARELHREYVAVVAGIPAAKTGTIDAGLARDPFHRQRFTVVERGGRHAVTHYAVERTLGTAAAVVRVTLETGRTHQIRVHFAAIGHPVMGDAAYGTAASRTALIGRQALHAARLSFVHPMTGKTLSCTAPVPRDILTLIRSLEARGR